MKTEHNYLREENSLTYGRYFVYRGAPSRAPGAVESKEAGGDKPEDKEKPATLKDVKDKLQGIKNILRRTTERHKKTAENNPKVKQLKQKIAEIEKRIKEVEHQKGEKRQKVINEVNGELDSILELKPKYPKPKGVTEKGEKPGGRTVALKFYKEGSKQFNKGNYPEAIKSFKKAEFHYPKAIGLQNDLALTYKQLGDNKNALKHYKIFIKRAKESKKGKYKKPIAEAENFVKKTEAKVRSSSASAPDKAKKPRETAPKPKGSPEGKEKPRENVDKLGGLKKKLGKLLDSVHDNTKEFHEVRGQMDEAIGKILTEMSIDLKNVQKTQFINLPGGYRMSVQKWTVNADKMPNAIIYKGKDLMCYRDYGVLRQGDLANNDSASRTAHIVKCFDQFPKSFRVVNDSFQITNLDNFVLMGIDIAQFSRQDKPWTARLASCRISYNPADKLVTIQPRGLKYKVVFNPRNTNKISFIKEGNPKPDVWDMNEWVEKPKDQKVRLKGEAKQRVENKKVLKKKNSELKRKRETARKKKENQQLKDRMINAEKAEVRGKVKKLLNPNFSKLVTPSKDDPKSFTVKAEKNNKKGLNLIENTPIHKLLKLNQSKSEVIMITIKGTKGTRKAMYYPGQTTAYVVNSKGKQTNNRVKFYNGDTISLDFKKPDKADYANLNRDKRSVKLKFTTKKSPSKSKSKPRKTPKKAKEGSETKETNKAKLKVLYKRYNARFKVVAKGRGYSLGGLIYSGERKGFMFIINKQGKSIGSLDLTTEDIGLRDVVLDNKIKAKLEQSDKNSKKGVEKKGLNEAKLRGSYIRYKARFKVVAKGLGYSLDEYSYYKPPTEGGYARILNQQGGTVGTIMIGMKTIGESNTSIDSKIKAALSKIDSKK